MLIALQPGECKIGSRHAFYQLPGGKRLNGKMIITNKRILCDAEFDLAAKGLIPESMFIRWGSRGYLDMDRQQIESVMLRKRLFYTEIVVTMKDASTHLFKTSWWGTKKWLRSFEM